MTSHLLIKKLTATLFFMIALPLILMASHFRYGTLSWENTSGNTVVFKISQSWRWSFFGNPAIGQTVYTDNFYFGDGTSTSVVLTVTSVNNTEDWFYGTATIIKTYAAAGNYNAYYGASCCRISTLQNNSNGSWRGETVVNVGSGAKSPISTILPIVNVPTNNAAAVINIPAAHPDGKTLSFRFATSSEAASPGTFVQPSGLSINSTTGQLTFNTVGKTVGYLYSTQVVVQDGTTKIPVDFIIRVTNEVINNNPPLFDYSITPADGHLVTTPVGQTVSFDIKALDNDAGNTLYTTVAGVPAGASFSPALPLSTNPAISQFSWTPTSADVGSYIMTINATDNHGASANTSVTITVLANSITTGINATRLCLGSSYNVSYTANGIYNSGNIFTAQLSNASGSFSSPVNIGSVVSTNSGLISSTVPLNTTAGSGYRIRVVSTSPAVIGSDNGTDITVNANPVINSVSGPLDPVPINTSMDLTVNFTDDDAVTAFINWGDGTSAQTISNPLNSFTTPHTYTAAGVYTVKVKLTDACGAISDEYKYEYVVVYDPSAGFVTGGGWINSPAGAFTADPQLTGKANFGFVSKYEKGKSVPSGNTQFQFHAADMNFKSTNYEWLVISGSKAQFKGIGTINDAGDYGFLLSSVDGNLNSPQTPDRFRIKIWDRNNNVVVYDNQIGAADDAVATTDISGGSIVIHAGKTTKSSINPDALQANDLHEQNVSAHFIVQVLPNPSLNYFTIITRSIDAKPVTVRVMDILGRVVEAKQNIAPNGTMRIGSNYRPGTYLVEVIQGDQRQVLKLIKAAN